MDAERSRKFREGRATTGIGIGLVLPSLAAAATHSLPGDRFAVGSGVNQAVRQIGSVLGVSVAIALVGTAHGPDAMPAFSRLFFILALGGFSTAAISAAIDTRPRNPVGDTLESQTEPHRGRGAFQVC